MQYSKIFVYFPFPAGKTEEAGRARREGGGPKEERIRGEDGVGKGTIKKSEPFIIIIIIKYSIITIILITNHIYIYYYYVS